MATTVKRRPASEPVHKRAMPKTAADAAAVRQQLEDEDRGNGIISRKQSPAAPRREVVRIPIGKIYRHPANREVRIEEVQGLADSIREAGRLLVPLRVRTVPRDSRYADVVPLGEYQLLAGERRLVACREVLHLEEVECEVDELLSDGEALRILCEDNAQRQDLDDLAKARAIRLLHAPLAEGGGGLTWEQAGRVYGLTGPSATNLAAILDAPPQWQEWFLDPPACGPRHWNEEDREPRKLHQATLREIGRYAAAPAVLEQIEDVYLRGYNWPETRDRQLEHVRRLVNNCTARVSEVDLPAGVSLEDPQVRERLGVMDLPGEDGQLVPTITRVEEYDALFQRRDEDEADEAPANKGRTPAEERELHKQQDEQLAKRIAEWRLKFLRLLAAREVDPEELPTQVAGLCLLCEARSHSYGGADPWEFAGQAAQALARGKVRASGGEQRMATVLAAFDWEDDPVADRERLWGAICLAILWPTQRLLETHVGVGDASGTAFEIDLIPEDLPHLRGEVIEQVAELLEVSLEAGWRHAGSGQEADRELRALAEQFLELHSTRQLQTLCKQWPGIDLPSKKADAITLILERHEARALALPKCLAGKKAKAGRPKKGK